MCVTLKAHAGLGNHIRNGKKHGTGMLRVLHVTF